MSRSALGRLKDAYLHHPDFFLQSDTFADDLELSLTMQRVNVTTVTSLDNEGRQLFLAMGLEEERGVTRERDGSHWIWQYDEKFREGLNCCSKNWLITHYIGLLAVIQQFFLGGGGGGVILNCFLLLL